MDRKATIVGRGGFLASYGYLSLSGLFNSNAISDQWADRQGATQGGAPKLRLSSLVDPWYERFIRCTRGPGEAEGKDTPGSDMFHTHQRTPDVDNQSIYSYVGVAHVMCCLS